MASLGDAKNLAQLLRERRADLKGSNNEVTQSEIADAIRQSQAQVWKLEQNQVDITKWFPERQLALLRAYRFTDTEIRDLSDRYGLAVTEYLNNLVSSSSNSAIVWFTDVLNAGVGERLPVPRTFLESKGVKEEDCEALLISGEVLMAESVRPALPTGAYLVVSSKAKPLAGRFLVYEHKELNSYVVFRYVEAPVRVPEMKADGSAGNFMGPDDANLKFVGVSIASINPHG